MATYERSVRVAAPLEAVWDFHSRVDGLFSVTPGWLDVRVESLRGPDGEADPEILEAGAEIRLSVAPFGAGPRVGWTSHVTERERGEGRAHFTDEMIQGPFTEWEHTHSFVAADGGTTVRDRVRYALPPGRLGRRLSPLAVLGLAPTFRYRHRRTKALLEGAETEATTPTG